jgi:hypothetical protein
LRELLEKTKVPQNLTKKLGLFIRNAIMAGLRKRFINTKASKNETEDAP